MEFYMINKTKVFIVIEAMVIVVISFGFGLFIGQKNAPKNELVIDKMVGQTFYANIESIKQYNDGRVHFNVRGLDVNDINYRGDFTFTVDDSMDITWRGEKIRASDLKEGTTISITFVDEVFSDISPTPLTEVVKIKILSDEL